MTADRFWRPRAGWGVAAIAAALVACRGAAPPRAADAESGASAASGAPAVPLDAADSAGLTASDAWSVNEVARRLREAGLAVRDSGETIHLDGLSAAGRLLHVGRGTLAVFVYSGRGARARDGAGLDTTLHGLPTLDTPHYIESGNLIAVLHTPDDATVERVTNALTARHTQGPP